MWRVANGLDNAAIGEIIGILIFREENHCKRNERCSDRLSGYLSYFGLKSATLATLWKKANRILYIVLLSVTLAGR